MNENQQYSSPQNCIDKLDLVERFVRELVSTINSGQFAEVRQKITQLQTATQQFKVEVQKLPEIKRTVAEQNFEIEHLNRRISKQLAGIQVANIKTQLFLEKYPKKMATGDAQPMINEQSFRCTFCNSSILPKAMGRIIQDFTFDMPLTRQKKEFVQNETETEKLTIFCMVDRAHDFDNVAVTKSHQGQVYLACGDCEMGPIGIQDKSGKYLVALERVKLV
uniref:Mediator complex subunit 9 n=1 Tax=Panagrolaimus sp. JU765 TaxID=591449 RepID=A0AC34QAI4_9BILA